MAPRRSARIAARPEVKIDPQTHERMAVEKPTRKSPRAGQLSNLQVIIPRGPRCGEALIPKDPPQRRKPVPSPSSPSSHGSEDFKDPGDPEDSSESETDSDSSDDDSEDGMEMEDSETESEDEYNEQSVGSHDYIECMHAHDLRNDPGRKYSTLSYDSRLEEGNEVYEEDDFVVNDDYESESSETHAGDVDDDFDLEINMERHPVLERERARVRRRMSSTSEGGDRGRRASTPLSGKTGRVRKLRRRRRSSASGSAGTPRKTSSLSYSSRRSSSLFVSDLVGDPTIRQHFIPEYPASDEEVGTEANSHTVQGVEVETGVEDELELFKKVSEDVLEEIIDAVALFGRRAHRNRPHVRFRLAAAVLEDEQIREALESAIAAGLGRKLSMADGTKRVSIGPKGR